MPVDEHPRAGDVGHAFLCSRQHGVPCRASGKKSDSIGLTNLPKTKSQKSMDTKVCDILIQGIDTIIDRDDNRADNVSTGIERGRLFEKAGRKILVASNIF